MELEPCISPMGGPTYLGLLPEWQPSPRQVCDTTSLCAPDVRIHLHSCLCQHPTAFHQCNRRFLGQSPKQRRSPTRRGRFVLDAIRTTYNTYEIRLFIGTNLGIPKWRRRRSLPEQRYNGRPSHVGWPTPTSQIHKYHQLPLPISVNSIHPK